MQSNDIETPFILEDKPKHLFVSLVHQTNNNVFIKVSTRLGSYEQAMRKNANNKFEIQLALTPNEIGSILVFSFEERSESKLIAAEKYQRAIKLDALTFSANSSYCLNLEWGTYPFEQSSYFIKNNASKKVLSFRSILEQIGPNNDSSFSNQLPISSCKAILSKEDFEFLKMTSDITKELALVDSMKDYSTQVLYKSYWVSVNCLNYEEKTNNLLDLHQSFPAQLNLEKAFNQIFDEASQYLPKLGVQSLKYELLVHLSEEPLENWYNSEWNKKSEGEADPISFTNVQAVIANKASPCSHFTNCICALKKSQGIICYEALENLLVLTCLDTGGVIKILDKFEIQIYNIRSFIFNDKEYIVAVDGKSIRVYEEYSRNWRKVSDIRHQIAVNSRITAELIQCPSMDSLSLLFCGESVDGILHFNLAGELLQKLPFPAIYTNYVQSEKNIIACLKSGIAKINLFDHKVLQKSNETCAFMKAELSTFQGNDAIFAVSGGNLYIYKAQSLEKIKEINVGGTLYDFLEWNFEKNQLLAMTSYSSGEVQIVNPSSGVKTTLKSGLGFSSHVSHCFYKGKSGLVIGGCYSAIHLVTKN